MFRESLKPAFKLLAEKVNELEVEFDNFPTVDEVNEALEKGKNEIPAPVDLTYYVLKSDLTVIFDDEQWAYFTDQPRTFLIESFGECVFNISTETADSNKNASFFEYMDNYHQIGYSLRVDDQYFYLCKDDETKILKLQEVIK